MKRGRVASLGTRSSSRAVGLAGDHEVLELKMRGGLAGSLRRAHVNEQV
jgi:hypothetical protein